MGKPVYLLLFLCIIFGNICFGQIKPNLIDSISMKPSKINIVDTGLKNALISFDSVKKKTKEKIISQRLSISQKIKTTFSNKFCRINNTLNDGLSNNPALPNIKHGFAIKNGFISYGFSNRSISDTPFLEKNLNQHVWYGYQNIDLFQQPFRFSYLIRKSNSAYFRDIYNFQMEYDVNSYRDLMLKDIREELIKQASQLKNDLLEMDYNISLKEFTKLNLIFNNTIRIQKYFESKELLNMPDSISFYEDSVAWRKMKDMKKSAYLFIQEYDSLKSKFDNATQRKDSLEKRYEEMRERILKYKSDVKTATEKGADPTAIAEVLTKYSLEHTGLKKGQIFFYYLKKLSIGRTQPNQTELINKNLAIKGLNFEYNSWYYIGLSAGIIDSRFKDFVKSSKRKDRLFMMLRAGVGKLEKNYFIVSAYKGQKQLYASGNNYTSLNNISVAGVATELRYKLSNTSFINFEMAKSISPDLKKYPLTQKRFSLTDKANLAYFGRLYIFLPKTKTKFDGSYKYLGSDFQSFSNFQPNATVNFWSLKMDQPMFKNKLKISAILKTNEYSNDLIQQRYNTKVFTKNFKASFKARNFPYVSMGYVPMSQLTYIGNVLTENIFQSFNWNVMHAYKLGRYKAFTTVSYNRFFNKANDSLILYYNAKNLLIIQQIVINRATLNIDFNSTENLNFRLFSASIGIDYKFTDWLSAGFASRPNNLNKKTASTSMNGHLSMKFMKTGLLTFVFDGAYIPTSDGRFVKNNTWSIDMKKYF